MKRGKVESILLIAVLALSMQVESYSVAISNRIKFITTIALRRELQIQS